MKELDTPKGVMDKTYAIERQKKLQLIFRYKVRARIVADAAKKYLGTEGPFRILDLGSADGLTLLELRSLLPYGTYVGVEYSDELLQCVPELPPDTCIVKGDAMKLPNSIKDKSYDIVSALALLEHLSDPFKAVKEVMNVLRPGGIFVATCPNPLWEDLSTKIGLLQGEQHQIDIDKEKIICIVEKAGMKVLTYERFMWAPITFLSYLKIPISPSFSLRFDKIIRDIKILDWLFVNQYIVARTPL